MKKFFLYLWISCITFTACIAALRQKTERLTYDNLISVNLLKLRVPAFKNRRAKELETLTSMIINNALDRIHDIMGNTSETMIKELRTYIRARDLVGHANDYVRTAYRYAIADFDAQIKRDNERIGGIGAITQSSLAQQKDLIKLELEELNERYSPIIDALKKLKLTTPLPQALSLETIEQFKPY